MEPTTSSRRPLLPQRFAAIAQRFGHMLAADLIDAVEVGKRSRHAQHAMETAGGQVQRFRRLAQQSDAGFVEDLERAEKALRGVSGGSDSLAPGWIATERASISAGYGNQHMPLVRGSSTTECP